MPKKCFVIMPYGGSDEAKRKHFSGVYQSIIAPAAAGAGYECKRSDIAAEPGNITHDIIRDLAEADIVIADLTGANANVFFELGVRHSFRKSGTVHLVDREHKLPFDIQQYRAIDYSTHLADIPDVIAAIGDAIRRREATPGRADNPVHDAIPELPIDLLSTGDKNLLAQLKQAEADLAKSRLELESAQRRLTEFDPSSPTPEGSPQVNIDLLLDRADEIMQHTGQHALLRLKEAINEGGADKFTKVLREVLKSPYLDQNDFMEIVVQCKELNLHGHRRATLDIANSRYPNSEPMLLALLDALDDSPNPADQQRGQKLLESRLGIQFSAGKPFLPNDALLANSFLSANSVALLFNSYLRQNQFDWIISVSEQLKKIDDLPIRKLALRNRARALTKLKRIEEAREAFKEATNLDPSDDQTMLWYSDFLDTCGDLEGAYELGENAIIMDSEDENLLLHLAIQIINKRYVRDASGAITGPVHRGKAVKTAIPLILRAVQVSPTPDTIERAVRTLVRAGALSEAALLSKGQMPPDDGYDSAALDHILSKAEASDGS